LRSAFEAGAVLVNYAEVTGFLEGQGCVSGVKARDSLSGNAFEVRGRTVVLACGPWTDGVTRMLTGARLKPSGGFAKAVNIVTRLIFEKYAVGVSTQEFNRDSAAAEEKRKRFLFIAPWRDRSLIGTAYMDSEEGPDELKITRPEIRDLLDQVNAACPSAGLKRDEITFVHGGLVPLAIRRSADGPINLARHYQIRDHRSEGAKGLISLIGVKYTTARDVAAKAVDHVLHSWDRKPPSSRSSQTPLHGGQIESFDAFLKDQMAREQRWDESTFRRLIWNYGSAYPEVLRSAPDRELGASRTDDFALLKAEVLHGVRMEMAQKLSDVVFRRTELGSAGHPGKAALQACADAMSAELGWDNKRTCQELQEVDEIFAARC
jgi:glycerol-3-phosphate dehydrogenase